MSDILSPRQTSAFGQVSDTEGVRRRFVSRKLLRIHAENTPGVARIDVLQSAYELLLTS